MSPPLLLSLLLASIFGLLFHSLLGRRLWQLPCYWLAAVAGFLTGEMVAVLIDVELLRIGTIPVGAATVGTLVGLGICWFFTSPPPETRARRRGVRR